MARNHNTTKSGNRFDDATIEAVWQKGTPEPGYPSFRKDTCGASMQRKEYGNTSVNYSLVELLARVHEPC